MSGKTSCKLNDSHMLKNDTNDITVNQRAAEAIEVNSSGLESKDTSKNKIK
jgi:hypothetical protein